jgi:hypothetical protein
MYSSEKCVCWGERAIKREKAMKHPAWCLACSDSYIGVILRDLPAKTSPFYFFSSSTEVQPTLSCFLCFLGGKVLPKSLPSLLSVDDQAQSLLAVDGGGLVICQTGLRIPHEG